MNDKREQKLIKRIQKRQDRRASDELIRLYYNEIYAYVYRQLSVKELAMDVTQEIFLGMLQTIWSYDSRKASFRTWLYRIATYKVVDYYRSREIWEDNFIISLEAMQDIQDDINGEDAKVLKRELPSIEDLENDYIRRESVRQIFEFLRKREVILEEIFRLKLYAGYTFEEISSILELPVSTVKTKYYTALKLIRKHGDLCERM